MSTPDRRAMLERNHPTLSIRCRMLGLARSGVYRPVPANELARFGKPEIFNTDQGSQFTSAAFIGRLASAGIRISMDGRGRRMDNVFIERL